MLRHFLYLNETMLTSYLGTIEGGLSNETLRKTRKQSDRSGKAGLKGGPVDIGGTKGSEESIEDERRLQEGPEQRFDRFLKALEDDPERYSFEEVLDLEDAWPRLRPGDFITVTCDVEVPQTSLLLSRGEEMSGLLDMMDAMRPLAGMFGKSETELPSMEQTAAMRSFTQVAKSDLVVVSEDEEDGSPRVAGKLLSAFVREVPSGEVMLVGKIAKRWQSGDAHSIMALPGASLLPRDQRRKNAAKQTDDTVLAGPAMSLDLLAIFR